MLTYYDAGRFVPLPDPINFYHRNTLVVTHLDIREVAKTLVDDSVEYHNGGRVADPLEQQYPSKHDVRLAFSRLDLIECRKEVAASVASVMMEGWTGKSVEASCHSALAVDNGLVARTAQQGHGWYRQR